jgi:hypothetical protein
MWMYNRLDGIKAWAPEIHHDFTTQSQPWQLGHGLGHLLGNSRTCGGHRLPPDASPSCRRLSNEWMDRSPLLGRPRGCIYDLGEPWALYEIFLGREGNLVSIKSASSRFSWFIALPYRHHISHVRTPNNANSVSRLCATELSSTLVDIGFLRNEDKILKTASKDNLSDFGLTGSRDFGGSYLIAPLSELGLPHVKIEGSVEAHNFGSQTFAIRGRLNLRICTERLCCPGLREYLSGWVDLVGKHPSPWSFACWCFGPWVVWSLVHFVSWLVTGFMIFSWSACELIPKVSSLMLISCVNNKLQNRHATVNLIPPGLVPLVRISNTCKCWR